MRKTLVAGVVSTIAAVLGTAMPAVAEPSGQAGVFVCGGLEVTIFTAGRNGWIDDTKYHAVTSSIEGTSTPPGGTPEPFSESKTWAGGKDASSPDLITCTVDFSEIDETGTLFEGHVEIAAVPVD